MSIVVTKMVSKDSGVPSFMNGIALDGLSQIMENRSEVEEEEQLVGKPCRGKRWKEGRKRGLPP